MFSQNHQEQNPHKDTAHIFSYKSTAHPTKLPWKANVGYRRQNSNEIRLTCKAGFEKTDVSRVGLWRAYHYFPEDTTPAVLFKDMVSITYQRLIKIVRDFFEKIVFGVHSKGSYFLNGNDHVLRAPTNGG
jgi:hypothetical protein